MERKSEQPEEMLYYRMRSYNIPSQWAMILKPNSQDNYIDNPVSVESLLECVIWTFLLKLIVVLAYN